MEKYTILFKDFSISVLKMLMRAKTFLESKNLIYPIFFLFLFTFTFHRAIYEVGHQGITMGHDSWDYDKWSDALIQSDYDPTIFFNSEKINFRGGSHTLYATFVYLVSLGKEIVGGDYKREVPLTRFVLPNYNRPEPKATKAWNIPIVILQIFFYVFTFLVIAYSLLKITGSLIPSFLACLLLSFSRAELLFWVSWVMSDISFVFFSTSTFAYLTYLLNKDEVSLQQKSFLFLLGFLTLFSRPNGVVAFLVILLAMTPLFWKRDFLKNHIFKLFCIGVALFIGIIVFNSQLMLDTIANRPIGDPTFYPENWIEANAYFFKIGMVVSSAKETFHSPPQDMWDMIVLHLDKFYHYYIFWPKHWNTIFERYADHYIPFYLMSLIAFLKLVKNREGSRQISTYFVFFLWILGLGGLTSITALDFNYRFRLSLIPIWALFSAYVFYYEVYPSFVRPIRESRWFKELALKVGT